jgi:hypothetical protein
MDFWLGKHGNNTVKAAWVTTEEEFVSVSEIFKIKTLEEASPKQFHQSESIFKFR